MMAWTTPFRSIILLTPFDVPVYLNSGDLFRGDLVSAASVRMLRFVADSCKRIEVPKIKSPK